jgi:RNA polymerase sigma factor (sigma-70 family)
VNEVVTLPRRLTESERALVEGPESERLVRWAVNHVCGTWPAADPREVAALAREAMVLAAPLYRPGKASFATYARKHVIGHIFDSLRRDFLARAPGLEVLVRQHVLLQNRQRSERTRALDAPTDAQARVRSRMARLAFELYMTATLHHASPEAILSWSQERERAEEALREACAELPPLEATVIERHYLEHVPLATIAEELGVGYRTVKRAHRRGRAQLRRALAARGITSFPDLLPE